MATALAMGDGDGDNISLNSITLRVSPSSVCWQQLGATTMRQPILLAVVAVVVVESLAFKIPHLMCLELHAACPFPFPFPFQSLSLCSSPFCIVAIFVVVASRRLTIFAGFTCKLDLIYCLTLPLQVGPLSSPLCLHHWPWRGRAWRGMPAADMACNKILIDVVHLHANCCQLKSPSPYAAPPPLPCTLLYSSPCLLHCGYQPITSQGRRMRHM